MVLGLEAGHDADVAVPHVEVVVVLELHHLVADGESFATALDAGVERGLK